ncbi:MAG: nitronate monooxygenase [Rhodospirillales bacterium]|nr:nitronate monooxygenase [Rhodospirillales bacterium]MDE0380449.1 nitronate monooxygenase [Rhodospirillales bacterium]
MTDAREIARSRLDAYWARGRAFLGTRYAIMGGAMSWVSERNLVAAISNAGGFGVVACGSLAPDQLAAEIDGVKERCDKPFGVNIIVMHPALDALVATCIERRVGHVVLAGGMPPKRTVETLKQAGTRVVAFASTLPLARRLAKQGVDALIIEGMEAGGHIGPVSTNVLAQEVLPHFDAVPVFVGGGIGRGDAVALYLAMGAAGCQLGTRFVCATESIAHPRFKQAMIRANARDARLSVQIDPDFPVIPVRAVANKATERFEAFQRETIARYRNGEVELADARLAIEHFWAGALRRAAIEGDIESGSLMAGQSVGMVRAEQPTSEIIADLVDQAVTVLAASAERGSASIDDRGSSTNRSLPAGV